MMLIEDIGRQLASKPFEWMSWWGDVKWGDFIEISPPLSKENPLWQRYSVELESLKLFKRDPNELQIEIAEYWQKPFWRRWFLSLFTEIDSKIVIWSYYQRCLSFQRIQQTPLLESRIIQYEPEQRIVNLLMNELRRNHADLEQRFESHLGNVEWMKKNFDSILARYEKKRNQFFFKLLDRCLKELPEDCERESLQRKLEDEFSELGRILRDYFKDWCQSSQKIREENSCQDLVYVGPTVVKKVVSSASGVELSSSLSSIHEWLRRGQEFVENVLKDPQPAYEEIQIFLQASLGRFEGLIESLLSDYERLIREVKYQQLDYKLVLDYTEHLQNRFSYYFRHGSLLFHPDKSGADQAISRIKTELFQSFQQIVDISYKRLSLDLKILERSIPVNEFDRVVKKIEQDMKKFKEQFNKKWVEIEADHAEIRAQQAELKAQHAELDIILNETKLELKQTKVRQVVVDDTLEGMKQNYARINQKLDGLFKQRHIHSEDQEISSDPTINAQFFRH